MTKTGNLILAAVVVAAIAFAAFAFLNARPAAPQVTFVSLQGEKITTAGLRGKVVLVNFWATDCATCVKEMPEIVATHMKYRDRGFETIAVAMRHDPPNYVLNYTETRQLPFKVALDTDGSAAKSFGDVKLTPTTFVIGKDGSILKRYVGIPEFTAMHQLIEKALSV